MLGRHRALEGDAVRLGELVAMAMLDEVKPLLLLERGLEILGPAQQASLTLLADPSLEYGLDEHRAMALDEPLDLILARIRPQDLGSREADEPQHSAAVEHARDLHVRAPSFIPSLVGFPPRDVPWTSDDSTQQKENDRDLNGAPNAGRYLREGQERRWTLPRPTHSSDRRSSADGVRLAGLGSGRRGRHGGRRGTRAWDRAFLLLHRRADHGGSRTAI